MAEEELRKSEVTTSRELLGVGESGGLYNKLLIHSKHKGKNGTTSPITRMPRSSILDRVQNFLPQMAQANESLGKEMENNPARFFDIENVGENEEKIIEMNVALVELSGSDSSEDETETSSEESSESEEEVTEDNLKLRHKVKKGKIEVLDN
ncbi:NOP protein chaperone 1 [Bombina bombina]|uniref:NOP protein chaperone 1 n=1 Tax=Bombina bombina TaxID=8345 RepID=UPI00235A4CD5|nr:NOP protein chaperone 1 [Bombina bombina]